MSLELISLVAAVIGLLITAVSLETNAQTDQQNITKILKPNATLTDLQKSAMVIKLLLMPNTIHFANGTHIILTPQQKIIICKAVIQGIENFKATYKAPAYNNSKSPLANGLAQSLAKPVAVYLWSSIYNKSFCANMTGHIKL